MRYVNLNRLERPVNWDDRAQDALEGLREEVKAAEAAARDGGKDIAEARCQAVRDGLSLSARSAVWRETSNALASLSNHKCWYSESTNPASDANVDHFRPKGRVEEDDAHEGYWWLAFDWRNYRYSSQWCNQRRNGANGTSGGKGDRFPLLPGSYRARKDGDPYEVEDPVLLDPTDPEDWKLLTFRADGYPTPTHGDGSIEYCRAIVSIEVYHLDNRQLVNERRRVAVRVEQVVDEMEVLRPKLKQRDSYKLYKRRIVDLLGLISWDAEYSAAALSFARSLVYPIGQVKKGKRCWLESILNERP